MSNIQTKQRLPDQVEIQLTNSFFLLELNYNKKQHTFTLKILMKRHKTQENVMMSVGRWEGDDLPCFIHNVEQL